MQTAPVRSTDLDRTTNSPHRSKERFFVSWWQLHRLLIASLASIALCLSLVAAPVAAQNNNAPVQQAIDWLKTKQQPDGGFAGFSGASDPGATIDAIFAMVAAQKLGIDADTEAAVRYLESGEVALVYAQISAGAAAKLSMALVATGNDPHDIGNVDPMSIVEVGAGLGTIGLGPYDHAIGIQALVATGTPVPQLAIDTARASQIEDGSWSFDGTMEPGAGDTNTTAMMTQALIAAGVKDEMVAQAIAYLASVQNEDGGFPYQPGAESDANSTALVLQAFIASGDASLKDARAEAEKALLAMQNASGAFFYMASAPEDNQFATVQAVPALAGVPFPILALAPASTVPQGTPAG